ncbi:MAG: hypothetical protein RSD57_01910 [Comamonas sp.]
MKWLATTCLALVLSVLSYHAFIGYDLSQGIIVNRFVALLAGIYSWLLATMGNTTSGILFAACAVATVVIAALDSYREKAGT